MTPLEGSQLFDLAFYLAQRPALTVELALEALRTHGVIDLDAVVEIRALMSTSLAGDRSYRRIGSLFQPRSEAAMRQRASALIRSKILLLPGGVPGIAQAPAPREQAEASALRAIPRPRADQRTRPSGATSTAPARPSTPVQAAVRQPVRAVPDSIAVSTPPQLDPPPVVFGTLSEDMLPPYLAAPTSELSSLTLSWLAHRLSLTQQFSDLLVLGTLNDVESHRYQIDTVRRVLRSLRGRALLADEVGLGKTVEAIMILCEYQLRGMVRRVLVLTPPALVRHWAGELASKAGITARTTEDPALRGDTERFFKDEGVVIASLAQARSARYAPIVSQQAWDMVIVDEAHHVKNRSTLGWKLIDSIKSRFLLLITATPIENDLEEIYNLVTLIEPGRFTTAAAFRRQFVDTKDPTSPRNREILRRLLSEIMVRNTRAASGLALPPRFVTTVKVSPLPTERQLYSTLIDVLRAHGEHPGARLAASTLLLEAGSSAAAVQGTLSKILAGNNHNPAFQNALVPIEAGYRAVDVSRKTEAMIDLVKSQPDQVLIFSRYRATLEHLARALAGVGIDAAVFHGGLSAEAKSKAIEQFRSGCRAMIATDVGGEGQNFQFCHVLINFDLPWNPMAIEQRIGRLHRMGQTSEVQVYNLCAEGTVEDRVLEVLDARLHMFELVVGETDMVLGNMSNEQDLEERILSLYATSKSDEDVDRGFDQIAQELSAARGRYEKTKALDAAVFGEDYET